MTQKEALARYGRAVVGRVTARRYGDDSEERRKDRPVDVQALGGVA